MSKVNPETSAADSNFAFLSKDEPLFFQLGRTAERLFAFDPNASLMKLRQLGEAMARSMAARLDIAFDERTTQSDLLYAMLRCILATTYIGKINLSPFVLRNGRRSDYLGGNLP